MGNKLMNENVVSEHQTRVDEICASRVEDLRVLDTLLDLADSGEFDTWQELLEDGDLSDLADTTATAYRIASNWLHDYEIYPDKTPDASDLFDTWVNDDVLDIEVNGVKRQGTWSVTRLVFVLTVGGPHVEFTTTGGDDVELSVSWSPEKANARVHVPTLASHLESLSDVLAE